jgi:hypothetical protein
MVGLAATLPASTLTARHVCVVDGRLALSRLGIVTLARLCGGCEVWLPSEVREILASARAYLDTADRLVPRPYCVRLRSIDRDAEADAVARELAQWERLPSNDDLAALVTFTLGDRADECAIPPHVDRSVRPRYAQYSAGLSYLMMASGYDWPRGEHVACWVRDALALSAALQPYGAVIVTRLEPDDFGAPALCDYADAWGVSSTEVEAGGGAGASALRDGLGRAGLGPLAWAGVTLAAVHVLVPGLPVLGDSDRGLDTDAVARLWQQAAVFWHRIWA